MLRLLKRWLFRAKPGPAADATDVLAALILAARDDPSFRARLLFVLRLPQAQREPLLRTALEQMKLRGEPEHIRNGFAVLATEAGARTARELLDPERPLLG